MLWAILGALALIAGAALALPLLRPKGPLLARAEYDAQVYRDQLEELDRDIARGTITAALARQAAQDLPAAEENAAALITRLGKILESRPDDLKGWTLYAGALSRTGRRAEAVTAWRRVIALTPGNAQFRSEYAEALIFASGGTVTPAAREAIAETLALDAKEPRARYYAGLAEYQAGRTEEALRRWLALEAESPPDAPWSKLLAARIATLKTDRGVKDETLTALRAEAREKARAREAPRGPSSEDVRAAQQMSPEDRQAGPKSPPKTHR